MVALLDVIEHEFELDMAKFRAEVIARAHGEAYDLYRHLASHGIQSPDVHQRLVRALSGGAFLYPDTPVFISRCHDLADIDLVVMSVGISSFQMLKIELCPELKNLQVMILEHNKGAWLEQEWRHELRLGDVVYGRATLLDDLPATFEALASRDNLQLIQVVRDTAKYPRTTLTSVHVVPDLSGLPTP